MRKVFILLVTIIFISTSLSYAAEKTINTTGMYIAGASESLNDAKQNAVKDAMRRATEQAGVLVSSYSKTHNMELTEDEVTVVATKIVKVISKRFDVQLLSDSEIKVIAYIEAVINTDSINEDIIKLKEQNNILTAENNNLTTENKKLKTKENSLKKLKDIAAKLKSSYYKYIPSVNETVKNVKTDTNTDYRTCIHNYYIHMIQKDFNNAGSDLTWAFLKHWDKNGLSQANIKNKRYYMDDAIFKLYLLMVESYIVQGEYYFAYDRIISLMIKSKVFNYIPKENDLMLMAKYGDALHDYFSLYEPETEKKLFEKYKNNPPDALP